ncbi:hypothetical protein CRT23_07200 [Methylobacterium sp. V23]|nr:hypothetical protein CRT23_07200 [Methylobacterium sp. V23]
MWDEGRLYARWIGDVYRAEAFPARRGASIPRFVAEHPVGRVDLAPDLHHFDASTRFESPGLRID